MPIFHRDEFIRKQADDAFAKAFSGNEARDKDGRWVHVGHEVRLPSGNVGTVTDSDRAAVTVKSHARIDSRPTEETYHNSEVKVLDSKHNEDVSRANAPKLKDISKVPRNADNIPVDPADRAKTHTKPYGGAKTVVERVAKEHRGSEARAFSAVLGGKSRSDQRAFVASKLDGHGTNGKKEATRLRAI
jgi:hypothetical protein